MLSRVTRNATNGLANVFAYQASFGKIRAARAHASLASEPRIRHPAAVDERLRLHHPEHMDSQHLSASVTRAAS